MPEIKIINMSDELDKGNNTIISKNCMSIKNLSGKRAGDTVFK